MLVHATLRVAMEFGQAIHLADRLGLGSYRLARIVLGTSFSPGDFLAYALGALIALAADHLWSRRRA
ncbi:DUF2809 domain-containing protein [Sphingomonas quercus]|uniref:DUF2809 domain-containing protein n=1 Tax=Sphingomonas quercus TaxID=2842451 RepID=A0ABS6BJ73_9SPHN|nr:DUF2809 domain-containing protein [Sphingomonas quercus]MBU3078363.1 DUF2809 domain-containing protein [Sphingomonas quercus]